MLDDTIAAISTAPGRAAIAVIRVSGPGVPNIVDRILGGPLAERRPALRWLAHAESGGRVDRVLATHFSSPNSYTGEHMLELSCHGGALVPLLALDAVLAAGARPAQPGEFTRRAYLNGKLDLLQAEAILDLIDGRSEAQHKAAIDQLDRGLSARIEALREAIIRCEALMVYEIDFPEEDEGPVPAQEIEAAARDAVDRIEGLLETSGEGELLRDGALTVIAGRPNVGKSSLFNALCGFERVIVTEEPGTTRDAVEAVVSLGGFPFRLVDTAGLRDTEQQVERMGIEVARRYLEGADIVLFCAEAERSLTAEEREFLAGVRDAAVVIMVRTKSDRATAERESAAADGREVFVSTQTGTGLADLRDGLVRSAFAGVLGADPEAPLVTRRRHSRALRQSRSELVSFLEARLAGHAPEIAATHLRTAAQTLEELLGIIGHEDLLDRVFSDFCIGK